MELSDLLKGLAGLTLLAAGCTPRYSLSPRDYLPVEIQKEPQATTMTAQVDPYDSYRITRPASRCR